MNRKNAVMTAVVVVGAFLLELCCFNFPFFYGKVFGSLAYNIQLGLNDFEKVNWEGTPPVSQFDPMLIYQGIDTEIDEIEIRVQADRLIPYVEFFFENEEFPTYCEKSLIHMDSAGDNCFIIPVSAHVKNMRIDLGDEAGVKLEDVSVLVNPLQLQFSAFRFGAMLVIYLGVKGLALLQRPPSYGIAWEAAGEENDGEGNE